jgi:hypothetical protein
VAVACCCVGGSPGGYRHGERESGVGAEVQGGARRVRGSRTIARVPAAGRRLQCGPAGWRGLQAR